MKRIITIIIVLAVIAAGIFLYVSFRTKMPPAGTEVKSLPPQQQSEILKNLAAPVKPMTSEEIQKQEAILKSLSAPVASSSATTTENQEDILKSLQAK